MKFAVGIIVAVISAVTSFTACRRHSDTVSLPDKGIVFERLDRAAYNGTFAAVDSAMLSALGHIMGFDVDSDSLLRAYSLSPAVRVFTPDVDMVFSDTDTLERQLAAVESGFESCMPDVVRHNYCAIVSPYNQSIYLYEDSIVMIALNHYLGADYAGYDGRFHEYEKVLKEPRRIPYDVAEAIVSVSYPFDSRGTVPTVVSRMLYEGALVEAVMRVVSGAAEADALGITHEQYDWLLANEASLWRELVGRRLLYSTSGADARKLLSPAPSTSVIGPQTPGRAGRFFGHRIVRSYLAQHPDVSPVDLLSPDFYLDDRALSQSGYRGGK